MSTACSSSRDATLRLAVGDAVVYAGHGVGRVVARDRQLVLGTERECVLVDLASGLRVTLPVDVAAGRLRSVADEAELASVKKMLADEPNGRDGSWTHRIKANKAKLASGRAVDLAELVRDGACHERPPGKESRRLSPGERRVYLQARQLLVEELCAARGVGQAEADIWIETQVSVREKGGG